MVNWIGKWKEKPIADTVSITLKFKATCFPFRQKNILSSKQF